MTKKNALKTIKDLITITPFSSLEINALNVAVEALKQPDIVYCKDCVYYREDGYCSRNNHTQLNKNWYCADGEKNNETD